MLYEKHRQSEDYVFNQLKNKLLLDDKFTYILTNDNEQLPELTSLSEFNDIKNDIEPLTNQTVCKLYDHKTVDERSRMLVSLYYSIVSNRMIKYQNESIREYLISLRNKKINNIRRPVDISIDEEAMEFNKAISLIS